MQDTLIISLLQKYIKNECTAEGLHTLFHWLKTSDHPAEFDQVIEPVWENINQTMPLPDESRENELRNEVLVLLNEIKLRKETPDPVIKKVKRPKSFYYAVAAVFILVFSATLSWLHLYDDSTTPITYSEKITQKGEKKKILLTDGTQVTLNSGTRLRIPSNFGEEERIVEMEGEGFFEVTRNPDKPFIIKSGTTNVKVLGTSFDFKSYQEDNFIKLTVSTGKVRVNVAEQDLQLSVSANEHLSVNKIDGDIRKESIEENNYIKWIQGSLYFNKEPIHEVINTINRNYNSKVVLQCKDCDFKITGTHDNKSLKSVLEAICFTTGLKIRQEGKTIILYDNL